MTVHSPMSQKASAGEAHVGPSMIQAAQTTAIH